MNRMTYTEEMLHDIKEELMNIRANMPKDKPQIPQARTTEQAILAVLEEMRDILKGKPQE